ncbi:MAG: HNH endonuclease [Lysinibacillus fusiformis]|nr:HNH endonuclease [Lysinibacillus fusiformis]MCT6929636.1 HNH endonuclease [Lysinibacillus fusiformis]MCT6934031.1 HNH endonuclease [Lysinibacillus fusiformis]
MYKIDISRFSDFNDKFNDFAMYCFKFCSEYNNQKNDASFDIRDVYGVFVGNNEESFIEIIKESQELRRELILISDSINTIKSDYLFQTINYPDIILGNKDISNYSCSEDLKNLFKRIYESTIKTKVFGKYSEVVGLETFKYIFSKIQPEFSVCPYCNSVHITTIYSKDHFLPKSKYPLLAIWLENLVISCQQCNEGLKNADTLLPSLHPYLNNITDYFKFKYLITDENNLEVDVEIDLNKSRIEQQATDNYLKLFKIKDRANTDIAKELAIYYKNIIKEVEKECIRNGDNKLEQIKLVLEDKIEFKLDSLNESDTKAVVRNTKLTIDFLTYLLESIMEHSEFIQFNINVKLGKYNIGNRVHT